MWVWEDLQDWYGDYGSEGQRGGRVCTSIEEEWRVSRYEGAVE